jgi:ankyrin repeat protein
LANDGPSCLGILLAQPGIDVNLRFEESLGTPLMVLARADKPNSDMLEALLQMQGIDVNAQNADGDTAAMVAAAHGHEWMIERLALMPGFEVNVKNARGETFVDIVRPLVEFEPKPGSHHHHEASDEEEEEDIDEDEDYIIDDSGASMTESD